MCLNEFEGFQVYQDTSIGYTFTHPYQFQLFWRSIFKYHNALSHPYSQCTVDILTTKIH